MPTLAGIARPKINRPPSRHKSIPPAKSCTSGRPIANIGGCRAIVTASCGRLSIVSADWRTQLCGISFHMITYRIYSLIDPRDGETRYVGITKCPLWLRFYQHTHKPCNLRLAAWINELSEAGAKPDIRCIDEMSVVPRIPGRVTETDSTLHAWENDWIVQYLMSGADLLNGKLDDVSITYKAIRST